VLIVYLIVCIICLISALRKVAKPLEKCGSKIGFSHKRAKQKQSDIEEFFQQEVLIIC